MTKQTKKLSSQTTVTTINAGQKIPLVDASGNVTQITPANLKTGIINQSELTTFYIRKTYGSVALMNADVASPIGTDGEHINVGDIVTVVNSTTTSGNGIYSYEGPTDGWKFQSGFSFQVEQVRSQDANTAPSSKLFDDTVTAQSFADVILTNPYTAGKTPRRIDDIAINSTTGEIWQSTSVTAAVTSWSCISAGYKGGRIITDLNSQTLTTFFTCYGTATGLPVTTESFYGIHINSNVLNLYAYQKITGYTTGNSYERRKVNSVWSAWIPIANTVQTTGTGTTAVMSQKAVTDTFTLKDTVTGISEYAAFSEIATYQIDDIVIYNNLLYKFIVVHAAGAWNIAHVISWSLNKNSNNQYNTLNDKVTEMLTSPEFDYYGIQWRTDVANSAITRIGREDYHRTLPIHALMRCCLINDNGEVVTYLNANDRTLTDTGAPADLSGASGQMAVEIPAHYRRFETVGVDERCKISFIALPGYSLVPKSYLSVTEAVIDRTISATPKLCSVVNSTAAFRGGNNDATRDGTYRSQLGLPATNVSLTNFRAYARNRGVAGKGGAGWNCYLYEVQKTVFWLYAIEFANFNCQLPFNAVTDANGFKQGGLGDGVTTLDSTIWNNFNERYPFVPCGYTNSLGNKTGVVSFTMPFEYDSNGSTNYIGVYNAATSYVAGNYVSSGTSLYVCILASTGHAVTDTTYFTPVTRKTVGVPAYRGIENPFGHILKWTDGCKCMIQSVASGGLSLFYICDTPANFTSSGTTDYQLRGNLPRVEGYIKEVILGEYGEIMPLSVGGSSTTYFCDYFYTSIPASGIDERGVLFGDDAYSGAGAGFGFVAAYGAATRTGTYFGSRLCFIPA